jgi:hypothetical protein
MNMKKIIIDGGQLILFALVYELSHLVDGQQL